VIEMRLIFYKKQAADGTDSTVYINLDMVDGIIIHHKDTVTELYFLKGSEMNLVYDKEKIISPDVVIGKLLAISDRSFINIELFITDCNKIAKTRR